MAAARQRLDLLVMEHGLASTQQQAQGLIRAGKVLVDDVVSDKVGTPTPRTARLRLRGARRPYVSRGGAKLAGGLDSFDVEPAGLVCADLGASTGGFTDCLLQRQAARVYAIDVGYGQLAWKLRCDPRVVVMERTNARHLDSLPSAPALVVGDLSFISLDKILPAILRISAPSAQAVLLVKPQFEVPRQDVARGGVVKDEAVRQRALQSVADTARTAGCEVLSTCTSPIVGAKKGNVEYLIHLRLPPAVPPSPTAQPQTQTTTTTTTTGEAS